MSTLYQIGEFAELIGVSIQTLRNWDASGKLKPHSTTRGGIRQYSSEQLAMYANRNNVVVRAKAFGFCYIYEDEDISKLSERMEILRNYMVDKGYDYTIKTAIIYTNTNVTLKQLGVDLKDIIRLVLLSDNRDPYHNLMTDILEQFNMKIEQVPYNMEGKVLGKPQTGSLIEDVKTLLESYPTVTREEAMEVSRIVLEKSFIE